MQPERIPGNGWIVLLGGGEFSFGETEAADRAWLAKLPGDAKVGFLPAASGSKEYGGHFADYLHDGFGREVETIPIYRARDARRRRNCERIAGCGALYLGGGVADHLLAALAGTPAAEALTGKLDEGGVVVAIAAAAQALGCLARSLKGRQLVAGLGWLPHGVVESNFVVADQRHLRRMLEHHAARWGLGITAGSAVLLGPQSTVEIVGEAFVLGNADGEIEPLSARSN